ncbi:MAG: DUF4153 domain-containing protein, partial [Chloroflexota bacterium]
RIGGLPQYLGGLVSAGFHACGGILVLTFFDIHWREVPRTGWSAVVLAVLRGLLIAIPLLMVFGGLFMAADAIFSGIVTKLLNVDVKELFSHLFWIGVWTWLTAGFLRQLLFCTIAIDGIGQASVAEALDPTTPAPIAGGETDTPEPGDAAVLPAPDTDAMPDEPASAPATRPSRPPRPGGRVGVLGIVELGVVLGLMDLLFLAFVVVQFRYLFGGAELVEVSPTLTFSEYARRGFFELVTVAALLLPLMLLLDWVARLDSPRQTLIYRVLAGTLVLLLFVVIVSALQRMRLYTLELGLTELRLYTTAFMLWITAGAVWYLATVLRDRRERYLFGASVAGLVVAFLLNVINPDSLIVQTNASRHDAPTRFDGLYTLRLSADAAPALIDVLDDIPESQRVQIAQSLLRRWENEERPDWRSWNYGRWRAAEVVAANQERLRVAANQPQQQDTSTVRPPRSNTRRDLDIPTPSDP